MNACVETSSERCELFDRKEVKLCVSLRNMKELSCNSETLVVVLKTK